MQDKKQLDSNTDRFNKVNSDFQENWNDEYWKYYEMVKDGSIHKRSGFKPELSVRVAHLQELATILDKNINDEKKPESVEEHEVPEEKLKQNPDPMVRKCCCAIF